MASTGELRRNFLKQMSSLFAGTLASPIMAHLPESPPPPESIPFHTIVDQELIGLQQEAFNVSHIIEVTDMHGFASAWEQAVEQSLATKRLVAVRLAAGEHVAQARLDLTIPRGAKILFMGSEEGEGTTLTAGEEIADGVRRAKEGNAEIYWSGSKHNLIKVTMAQGAELVMKNLQLNGGCEEAGVAGGYEAPTGPWNSIVRVVGEGPGDQYQPIRWAERMRRGLVIVENVSVKKSQAPGVLVQNVRGFWGDNIQAEDVDAGVVVNWCDRFILKKCTTKRGLSDGIYVIDNLSGEIFDCAGEACRQGLDIQGGGSVIVRRFNAKDCAIAYRLGQAQADQYPLHYLYLEAGNSDGSGLAYSLGRVKGKIVNARHTNLGGWVAGYDAHLFSHEGIVKPKQILGLNRAVWREPGVQQLEYSNIQGTKSPNAPAGYDDSLPR